MVNIWLRKESIEKLELVGSVVVFARTRTYICMRAYTLCNTLLLWHVPTSLAVFCQCGCLEESMAAFERAGCWRQVFTVTAQLNNAPPERMAMARRIAS